MSLETSEQAVATVAVGAAEVGHVLPCERSSAESLSEKGSDPLRRGQKPNEIDSPPKAQTPFQRGSDRLGSGKRPIDDRYHCLGELGRGGWGVVERALDCQLEREVAVKRLVVPARDQREMQNRFLHEAKITSRLQHPGIVPVHELSVTAGGEPFYVMKLLSGKSLAVMIQDWHQTTPESPTTGTAIPWDLLHRFVNVCHAMAYAHHQGVIHRDLKPSNVMVGALGETVVVDWGLARTLGEHERVGATHEGAVVSENQTASGSILGTPAYMSPEQARGEIDHLGPASDIYSLGVILYEILSGQKPITDADLATMLRRVGDGDWRPLRQLNSAIPRPLGAICEVAMSLDPARRYDSAETLADDVRRFIAGEVVGVYREPWYDRVRRWGRGHQTLVVALAVFHGMLLIAAIMFSVTIHHAHQVECRLRVTAESSQREAIAQRDAAHHAWRELHLAKQVLDDIDLESINETDAARLRAFQLQYEQGRASITP